MDRPLCPVYTPVNCQFRNKPAETEAMCTSRYQLHCRWQAGLCTDIVSVSVETVNVIGEMLVVISVVCFISTDSLRNHLGFSECVCQFGGAPHPQLFVSL